MKGIGILLLCLLTLAGPLAAQTAQSSPADLVANRDLWPSRLTLKSELSVPLVVDGKTVGSAAVPAGTVLPLAKIADGKAHLNFNGNLVVTDLANTDFTERAQEKRRVAEYRDKLASAGSAAPVVPPAAAMGSPAGPPTAVALPSGKVAQSLGSSLVSLQGDKVEKFAQAKLASVKFYAIYFSASWCGPCRRFTPNLVNFYNELKPKHPEFELVFASRDQSTSAMEKYMKTDSMPWPALSPTEVKAKGPINDLAGPGIPCLVFIDADGKVLSHSYQGREYLGPQKVMRDIQAKLAEGK